MQSASLSSTFHERNNSDVIFRFVLCRPRKHLEDIKKVCLIEKTPRFTKGFVLTNSYSGFQRTFTVVWTPQKELREETNRIVVREEHAPLFLKCLWGDKGILNAFRGRKQGSRSYIIKAFYPTNSYQFYTGFASASLQIRLGISLVRVI